MNTHQDIIRKLPKSIMEMLPCKNCNRPCYKNLLLSNNDYEILSQVQKISNKKQNIGSNRCK